MSPPQFKALSNVMIGQIKNYESQFGEILDTMGESPRSKNE